MQKPLGLNVYKLRQNSIMAEMKDPSIFILKGASLKVRNSDVHYRFRQSSDFLYLTGHPSPDSTLVLVKTLESAKSLLFIPRQSDQEKLWVGSNASTQEVMMASGVDEVCYQELFDERLLQSLEGCEQIFYTLGQDEAFDQRLLKLLNQNLKKRKGLALLPIIDGTRFIHEARLFKRPEEVEQIKKIVEISAKAHNHLMQIASRLRTELEFESAFLYYLAQEGSREVAYPTIVGSGANGCILHYTDNKASLQRDDLVLVDGGGEWGGYAADITRTFPLGGKFSSSQRALYEVVFNAQEAAIQGLSLSARWSSIQATLIDNLTQGLHSLGILKGSIAELIETQACKAFYPHSSGHWLGLDVHDVGAYSVQGQSRILEKNMVFTIEPGIYIPRDCDTVAPHWRGIGIRIEDDFLMTETGPYNLSQAAVKSIQDIEAMMGQHE